MSPIVIVLVLVILALTGRLGRQARWRLGGRLPEPMCGAPVQWPRTGVSRKNQAV